MRQDWAQEVLRYWFGELTPRDWFAGEASLDEDIRRRFADLRREVAACPPDAATAPAAEILAAVIVLDQFSRNMFRGSPKAFAGDPLARQLAREAIRRGIDREMGPQERRFLYMPLMHSESAADQRESLRLFEALGEEYGARYARHHKEVIDRFGRFPHRNAVLGRQSTAEELAYLSTHRM